MFFSAFIYFFSRMVYTIEVAILKPVSSRVSIYACMKKCPPATIWFTFIYFFLYKLVKRIYRISICNVPNDKITNLK